MPVHHDCPLVRTHLAGTGFDRVGKAALHYASKKGYREVCQPQLEHIGIDAMDIVAPTLETRNEGSAAELTQNKGPRKKAMPGPGGIDGKKLMQLDWFEIVGWESTCRKNKKLPCLGFRNSRSSLRS